MGYNICASEADVCKNECNACAICYGFDPSKMCAAPEVVNMGQPAAGPVVDMNTGGSVAAAPAETKHNPACDSVCDYTICASEADVCKNECNACAICYGFDPSKMCAAPEVVNMG